MTFDRVGIQRCFLVFSLLVFAGGCVTHNQPKFGRADVSKPGFFPILPWDSYHRWGPKLLERPNNGMESIAQCDFNCAGFVLPMDLPRCQKLGLSAIMASTDSDFTNVNYIYEWRKLSDAQIDGRVKRVVQAAGSNPAIAGYFITDEPGAADFPALAKAVAAVKKYAPGKLAYINLFPNYATLGAPDTSQLGTPTYTEYLEKFVAEVQPQLISYDNYMVQYSTDLRDRGTAANYYNNLLEVRRVALEHNLPYLNIVASGQISPSGTPPSPDNLRFQAYTTLAAGYRGVTWYTYFGDYPCASIDKNGNKTPTWDALREVNHEVAALAPVMSQLTSTGVYFTAPTPADNLPQLPGKLIQSATCSAPIMAGEFEAPNGDRYAMLVNLSLEHSASVTLKTTGAVPAINIISAADGSISRFDTKTGLWLTAGQGVLLALGK